MILIVEVHFTLKKDEYCCGELVRNLSEITTILKASLY